MKNNTMTLQILLPTPEGEGKPRTATLVLYRRWIKYAEIRKEDIIIHYMKGDILWFSTRQPTDYKQISENTFKWLRNFIKKGRF